MDGGGVDDEVLDAVVLEVAMEPEAIAAGLVAGDDRRFLGQAEPAPSGPDLADQGVDVACRDGVKPGLLPGPDGEGQLPGGLAQLQCEVERRRGHRARIGHVGR